MRIKEEDSQDNLRRELYAMREGMDRGIAPQIFCVSKDLKAVLMDYVGPKTLTLNEAKCPENCRKIAETIRKVHAIPKNPYAQESSGDEVANVYLEMADHPGIASQLEEALELAKAYRSRLAEMDSYRVNIHGELNPRNIFIIDGGAIFIDWEYTGWDDPFFDLSYLALRLDYNESEEMFLLENYLQRPVAHDDLKRYELAKKIHLSELCIYFHYFSLKFLTSAI